MSQHFSIHIEGLDLQFWRDLIESREGDGRVRHTEMI